MDSTLTDGQRLSAAILAAEQRYPYFATGFSGLVRRFAPVRTMAITKTGILLVDPDFLAAITAPQAGEVVSHELLHLLRRHVERREALPQVDLDIWGDAVDCEVNDDLHEDLLPADPCLPKKYGLQNGQMAEEYYQELIKQAQQQAKAGGGAKEGEGKGGNPSGKADVARGRCGSGSGGPPVDGEPEGAAGAKPRSAADLDRIRRDVAEAIQQHVAQKGRGSVPGGLLVWAESELQPPKVRWQDQLRRAIRAGVATIAGRVDYTRTRFSRRQAAFGAVARALGGSTPLMPALCAPRPRVAFGVDTSGSMGHDELVRAVSEAQGCLRAIGTPIVFLACDAAVHETREVRTAAELASQLKGGGGTDFRPVFQAVEELRPKVDLFVFVTDGQGPAPAEAPRGFDVLWLLVGEYATAPCNWGKQLFLKD